MSDPTSKLPARPSLEQLRKQAKELLRAARAGDRAAAARLRRTGPRSAQSDPTSAMLADAQLVVAREYGFASWPELVRHARDLVGDASAARPLVRPMELRGAHPYTLRDGTVTTTEEVFRMFVAARAGDLREVKALIARAPALAVVEYNYTPPIHFAVREGHLAVAELLVECGAEIGNYRSYPFGDSLLLMAEERDHGEVAAFLRRCLSRRFALGAGAQALIDAVRDGDATRAEALLARDPTLARASNETGDTALHQAARHGRHDLVRALLDAGADPDAIRGDGYRPIHCALMWNWVVGAPTERGRSIAELLVVRGARYSVFVAALLGDYGFVRDALRRDRTAANAEDTCHHRPISAAARRNDLALARLLLDHGADPNAPEEGAPRGHALWSAVHERHREMTALLLAHGADPNAMVESSGTPMEQARHDPELLALLRAHGGVEHASERDRLARLIADGDLRGVERMVRADSTLLDDDKASWGEGILAGPAHAGNHEMIALLVRLGARVPPVTKWAPYYYFKHEATAAFLLDQGMDPNHMNWHRLTLLHHTAAEGELGKVRALAEHGADIDAVDDEYRSTPLGLAARRGQREVVAYLLERGADPELAGAPWATPPAWARKRGHGDIATMLSPGR